MKKPLAMAVLAILAGGCSDNNPAQIVPPKPITVMTRNIYVGAEFEPLLTTPLNQVPIAAAVIWGKVQATNFPERAGRLAAEIQANNPDVVGLQELSWFYQQSPSDMIGGGTTPATTKVLDFLQLLRDSLAARGLAYTVAVVDTTSDMEVPILTDPNGPSFDDLRWVDGDAILVRSDLGFTDPRHGIYQAKIAIDMGGGVQLNLVRGWGSVDVTLGARAYRFFNTHLESTDATVQEAQGAELLTMAAAETRPMIFTGDFNSQADGSGSHTYQNLTTGGLGDAWVKAHGADPGFTCCHAEDLKNQAVALDLRIDIILVHMGGAGANGACAIDSATAVIFGNTVGERTASGLWPSDHAGLAAQIWYKN